MADKNTVYLADGTAWRLDNGRRVPIKSMEVSTGDECCKIDCCNARISYVSPTTGLLTHLNLDDIAITLGLIPASSSNAPASSSPVASSSNLPDSSSGAPSSSAVVSSSNLPDSSSAVVSSSGPPVSSSNPASSSTPVSSSLPPASSSTPAASSSAPASSSGA